MSRFPVTYSNIKYDATGAISRHTVPTVYHIYFIIFILFSFVTIVAFLLEFC